MNLSLILYLIIMEKLAEEYKEEEVPKYEFSSKEEELIMKLRMDYILELMINGLMQK